MATATGALLISCLALTSAVVVEIADGRTILQASAENDFDIQVTGVEGADLGSAGPWRQGRPTGYDVPLSGGARLAPGDTRRFTLGVRNASPDLPASLTMRVLDPDPDADDDLFPALRFTVTHDGLVLADAVPGAELGRLRSLPLGEHAAGADTSVKLDISLPAEVDNQYASAHTRVSVEMRGENR